MTLPPDVAMSLFYNDLEPEEARYWASLLKPQSAGWVVSTSYLIVIERNSSVLKSPITHETYRDIPSGYLLTANDQALKYEFQLKIVQDRGFTVTRTLETGHSPFLSKPDEVKQFIIRAADKFEAVKDVWWGRRLHNNKYADCSHSP